MAKEKGFLLTVKVDPLRVVRGPRIIGRSARFGCGKHPGRAASKRAWQRQS